MIEKNTGGPAFPNVSIKTKEGIEVWGDSGITLRDYFAAKAMQGICQNSDLGGWSPSIIAREAYDIADAMLKVREA